MPSKSKQVKTTPRGRKLNLAWDQPVTPKRGRGRPSKLEAQLAQECAAHLACVDFIRSLAEDETEEWLSNRGYLTHAQVYAGEMRAADEKRAKLEQTIADAQAELAALDCRPTSAVKDPFNGRGDPGEVGVV